MPISSVGWSQPTLFPNPIEREASKPTRRPRVVPCVCPHCKAGLLVSPAEVVIVQPPPRKRVRTPKVRRLTEISDALLEELHNRVWDAVEGHPGDTPEQAAKYQRFGKISLDPDDEETGEVAVTLGEINTLLRIMLREIYRERPLPKWCSHPPKSEAKVEEMARRAEAGLSTTSKQDADGGDGMEVIGTGRGDRMKIEVIGWSGK